MEEYSTIKLIERWISILRNKAEYEHNDRKNGKPVTGPSIDEVCNEMIAYCTGALDL